MIDNNFLKDLPGRPTEYRVLKKIGDGIVFRELYKLLRTEWDRLNFGVFGSELQDMLREYRPDF